jgi:hypothetical protein
LLNRYLDITVPLSMLLAGNMSIDITLPLSMLFAGNMLVREGSLGVVEALDGPSDPRGVSRGVMLPAILPPPVDLRNFMAWSLRSCAAAYCPVMLAMSSAVNPVNRKYSKNYSLIIDRKTCQQEIQ